MYKGSEGHGSTLGILTQDHLLLSLHTVQYLLKEFTTNRLLNQDEERKKEWTTNLTHILPTSRQNLLLLFPVWDPYRLVCGPMSDPGIPEVRRLGCIDET